jgi:LPS export ABC transporter protein LptC
VIQRRTGWGILALGLLAAFSFWLTRDAGQEEQAAIYGLDPRLDYALRNFEARYFDQQGRLAARVEAPVFANDAATGEGRIEQPRFEIVHEGALWTILSESAILTPDRERVRFAGIVDMVREEASTAQPLEVQSSEVILEIGPRIVRSTRAVAIREGDSTLEATGFRLDMTKETFQLASKVRGRYVVR